MDEIVRRLFQTKKKDNIFINESRDLYEEETDLPDEEETDLSDEEVDDSPKLSSRKSQQQYPDDVEDSVDDDKDSPNIEKKVVKENPNPLDNPYAARFKLGDPVVLAYTNGTNSALQGVVEGYDKEGFYRIRWSDGSTTNGITDISLSDLIVANYENKCICGSNNLVTEGNSIVCDKCGRHIRDFKDPLTIADNSRSKNKKLIRSEMSDTSTTIKPDISESIKSIFKKSLKEDEEYEESESSIPDEFSNLTKLQGEFWTRLPELQEDIEDLGYIVEDINAEYVVVASPDDDVEYSLYIPMGGTSRTMNLDFDRSRELR